MLEIASTAGRRHAFRRFAADATTGTATPSYTATELSNFLWPDFDGEWGILGSRIE
jgi:hypothetical protein